MKNSTITDYFNEQLELLNIDVTNAIFTTYALDISFFECEIVPLLFSDDETFSNDARIKELQVREKLEDTGIKVNLFYDSNCDEVVEQSGVRSFPSMEYGFYDISIGGAVFHPKIVMVLGKDRSENDSLKKKLFLFVGSNNLTKAGWWENIEVCTSLSFTEGDSINNTTIENLSATLEYLSQLSSVDTMNAEALTPFREFVSTLIGATVSLEMGAYYFSSRGHTSFPAFISSQLGGNFKTKVIVSPYFPEDEETSIVDAISTETPFSIYLPRNGEKALLTEGLFNHIKSKNGIWSEFVKDVSIELNPDKTVFRRVHAKLYEFTDNHYFIGSVNFTRKAFFDNVEAGILFKSKKNISLLTPFTGDLTFSTHEELHKQHSEKDDENTSLDISLHFDWNTKSLKAYRRSDEKSVSVSIHNSSGTELASFEFKRDAHLYEISENLNELIAHLEKNSFVYVFADELQENIYVHQSNWTHKPLDYPDLTPDEIIRIYVELNKKRDLTNRGSILIEAMYRLFQQDKLGYGSEYTVAEAVKSDRSFFSEYAEIFYGFRKLNQLMEDKVDKRPYFLTSERPDALPSLIKSVTDDKSSVLDAVSRYLVLLSIEEIYSKFATEENSRTTTVLSELQSEVKKLEETLVADKDDKLFLEWFKTQFFKEYKKAGENE